MRDAIHARRWLIVVCLLIAAGAAGLIRWHVPRQTDPLDTALAVVMATMALGYLVFMLLTRREWPAASLGIFALLLGDLVLWGGLVFLVRSGVMTTHTNAMLNLLRACFFAAGIILLIDLVRWVNERWSRNWMRRLWTWRRRRRAVRP